MATKGSTNLEQVREKLDAAVKEVENREGVLTALEAQAREARLRDDLPAAEKIARAFPDAEAGIRAAREEMRGLRAAVLVLERTQGRRARLEALRARLEIMKAHRENFGKLMALIGDFRDLATAWCSLASKEAETYAALAERNRGDVAPSSLCLSVGGSIGPGTREEWAMDGQRKNADAAVQRTTVEIQALEKELGDAATAGKK